MVGHQKSQGGRSGKVEHAATPLPNPEVPKAWGVHHLKPKSTFSVMKLPSAKEKMNRYLPDYTITIGTEQERYTFEVHKSIICLNSDYFKRLFNASVFQEVKNEVSEFPDFEVDIMQIVLEYLYDAAYCDKVATILLPDEGLGIFQVVQILKYADYLQISGLQKLAIDALANLNFDVRSWNDCNVVNEAITTLSEVVDVNEKEIEVAIQLLFSNLCKNGWDKTRLRKKQIRKLVGEDMGAMGDLVEKNIGHKY